MSSKREGERESVHTHTPNDVKFIKYPCTEHHWITPFGDNRCTGCQMKYSYWLDVKKAIDSGNVNAEDWACKPHFHNIKETSTVTPVRMRKGKGACTYE